MNLSEFIKIEHACASILSVINLTDHAHLEISDWSDGTCIDQIALTLSQCGYVVDFNECTGIHTANGIATVLVVDTPFKISRKVANKYSYIVVFNNALTIIEPTNRYFVTENV